MKHLIKLLIIMLALTSCAKPFTISKREKLAYGFKYKSFGQKRDYLYCQFSNSGIDISDFTFDELKTFNYEIADFGFQIELENKNFSLVKTDEMRVQCVSIWHYVWERAQTCEKDIGAHTRELTFATSKGKFRVIAGSHYYNEDSDHYEIMYAYLVLLKSDKGRIETYEDDRVNGIKLNKSYNEADVYKSLINCKKETCDQAKIIVFGTKLASEPEQKEKQETYKRLIKEIYQKNN